MIKGKSEFIVIFYINEDKHLILLFLVRVARGHWHLFLCEFIPFLYPLLDFKNVCVLWGLTFGPHQCFYCLFSQGSLVF